MKILFEEIFQLYVFYFVRRPSNAKIFFFDNDRYYLDPYEYYVHKTLVKTKLAIGIQFKSDYS